jgi:Fur family transcriptional regulator, ferric uptake regulator
MWGMNTKTKAREVIDEVLRHCGLRSTPARRAILEAMRGSGPLREDEIASRVAYVAPDPATVYRTLGTFEKIGLVRRHRFHDPVWYYSLHLPGKPECSHAHFVCDSCGECECLEDTDLPNLPNKIGDKVITGVEVVINGLCNSCRKGSK